MVKKLNVAEDASKTMNIVNTKYLNQVAEFCITL